MRTILLCLLLAGTTPDGWVRPVPAPSDQDPGSAPEARRSVPAATISGRAVMWPARTPARRVVVVCRSELEAVVGTLTDDGGRYQITGLQPGRYQITGHREGFIVSPLRSKTSWAQPIVVEVAGGVTVAEQDLRLTRAATISGHIVDAYGEPVADSPVWAERWRQEPGRRVLVSASYARSDDRGLFRLHSLSPGTYWLAASEESASRLARAFSSAFSDSLVIEADDSDRHGAWSDTSVTVRAGQDVTSVQLALPAAPTPIVSGNVRASRSVPATMTTDLAVIPFGVSGNVTVVRRGSTLGPGGRLEGDGTATSGGPATLSGRVLFVGARGETPPGPIRVAVVTPNNLDSRILEWSLRSLGIVSDGGTFVVSTSAGSRVLRVEGVMPGWMVRSVQRQGQDLTDRPFNVEPNAELTDFEITLTSRLTEVSGVVPNPNGTRLGDYVVVAFSREARLWPFAPRAIGVGYPDQHGRFVIRGLGAGEYLIVAIDSIEQHAWLESAFLERLRPVATRITLEHETPVLLSLPLVELENR